jgi:peptide/nickel transport system permease protein
VRWAIEHSTVSRGLGGIRGRLTRRPETDSHRTARISARWIAARVLQLIPVVVGVVLVTFLLVHLVPGDPALGILGQHATPSSLSALRHAMHLDEPMRDQLSRYLSGLVHGNLGDSLGQPGRSVAGIVLPAMWVTLALTGFVVAVSTLVGIPFGLAAALSGRPTVDAAVRIVVAVLLATPPFLIGFFLLLVVALDAGIAPVGGWGSNPSDDLVHVWLPGVALAAYLTPIIVRTVRQSAIETCEQEFIQAATARGLRQRTLVLRHILPNSVLPVITIVGFNIGGLLSGAVVIEAVFNLPGIGTVLVRAVETRDYPVVQATALLAAVLVVVVTLLTDVLCLLVDPRTRVVK